MKCNVCIEVFGLYGTTIHVAPWLCKCNQDSILKTTAAPVVQQLQFSLSGKLGRFCRRGCCDLSDKYARSICNS